MKRISIMAFAAILGIAVTFTVYSCKKDTAAQAVTSPIGHKKTLIATSGVSKSNGIMIFRDNAALGTTVKSLADQVEADVMAFTSGKENYTVEKAQTAATAAGYNEDQTFIDFENNFNFHSMRLDFQAMQTTWAANSWPDNDPGNPYTYFPTFADPVLAVLNSAGEIGIGSEYFKIMRNGVVYEVTDGDLTTLRNITDENMGTEYVASNVVTHFSERLHKSLTDCTNWASASGNNNYNSPWHMQDLIEIKDIWFMSWVHATNHNWVNGVNSSLGNLSTGFKYDDQHHCESLGHIPQAPVQLSYAWCRSRNHYDWTFFAGNGNNFSAKRKDFRSSSNTTWNNIVAHHEQPLP